jgi:hypothetical protein
MVSDLPGIGLIQIKPLVRGDLRQPGRAVGWPLPKWTPGQAAVLETQTMCC